MKQKSSGTLIFDILIATMIAGMAISVAIRMPVMLVNFWKKIQVKVNDSVLRSRVVNLLYQDFSTILLPEAYLKNIKLKKKEDLPSSNKPNEDSLKEVKDEGKEDKKDGGDKKKPELFFLSKVLGKNLEYCFFVNTNLIPGFLKKQVVIGGLFYYLQQMPASIFETNIILNSLKNESLFQLVRIESDFFSIADDFDFKKYSETVSGVVVLRFVKSFEVEFTGFIKPVPGDVPAVDGGLKKPEPVPEKATNDLKTEIKTANSWPIEGVESSLLPSIIKIKCQYLDDQLEEKNFELDVSVFSSFVLDANSMFGSAEKSVKNSAVTKEEEAKVKVENG